MLQSLRSLWRSARDRRAFRPFVAGFDRLWWARAIERADLVDLDYVGAQTGRDLTARAAIRRYVGGGYRNGFRLNPLFVDSAVGDHLPEAWRVPALYAYVIADPRGLQVSPLWDAVAYGERHPDAWDVPGGPVAHAWHRRRRDSLPFGPDAAPSPAPWDVLNDVIADAAHRARVGGEVPAPAGTVPLDRELLIALGPEEWDFDESIAEAVAFAAVPGQGAAIAVLDARAEDWTLARIAAASTDRIRVSRRRHDDPSAALDELRRTSLATVLIMRGPNQTLTAADAAVLADRVERDAPGTFLAPVWLDGDGTIAAVGATAEGRLLAGHPAEDLAALLDSGPTCEVPALAGSTFAARRHDLRTDLRGTDAATLASAEGRACVSLDLFTRTRSQVAAAQLPPIAEDAGALLQRAGWDRIDSGPSPRVRRPVRETVLADGSRVPVLRWALRTAAPVGPRAEGWGDTHFARALAAALRRLGQEVVIDAYAARDRATRHLDDVTVALRGPEPLEASPYGVSLLWIISHPDQIGPADVAGFDAVFAASVPWARRATAELGVPISALLQCTDSTRFHPSGAPRTHDILFVGTARGILRPSVVEPIRAGIPVTVIGPDWRGWIPAERIAATGVGNDALPGLYERAGVVLNDHWPAMQERGFIGNRLFDVVAAGGRAISDRVDGIPDLFEGAVRTYDEIPELIAMLSGDLDATFPSAEQLARIGERVRAAHSFDARARTLLDAALTARGRGPGDGATSRGLAS